MMTNSIAGYKNCHNPRKLTSKGEIPAKKVE
jgi:hypothetical protein